MTNPEMRLGDSIIQDLRTTGDADFGKSRSIFVHTDQETFGVPLPAIKKLVKKHLKAYELERTPIPLQEEAMYLLEQPVFDSKIAGIQILAALSEEQVFADTKTIEGIIKYTPGWALVDTLATDVVATMIKNNPDETGSLIDWAMSDDNWLRRCSIVSLIKARGYIKDWSGYKKRILDQLSDESDPYVKKAIKWLKLTA